MPPKPAEKKPSSTAGKAPASSAGKGAAPRTAQVDAVPQRSGA